MSAADLDRVWRDDAGDEEPADTIRRRLHTAQLQEGYVLRAAHLAALVDAVLAGQLSMAALDAICFALETSDGFDWDTETREGERVGRGLTLLTSPEVNYPLTTIVLRKLRRYLLTGEDTLTPADKRRASVS
jgi:hypothetical protein